jgi:antitoxin component YwqK of YwqJK toxin-antitoxin module
MEIPSRAYGKITKRMEQGVIEVKAKGEVHEGVWLNDLKEGEFTELRPQDKIRLVGNFTNGVRNGVFKFLDINTGEQVKTEEWKEGVLLYNK